jgi:hypothetical protein
LLLTLILVPAAWGFGSQATADHPTELLSLAEAFRAWRAPPPGVPDYASLAARKRSELPEFRRRLASLANVRSWPVHAQADYLILRAEMDAEEFRLRALRPWSRAAVFYTETAIGNVRRHLISGRRLRPGTVPYPTERAQAILQALSEVEAIVSQAPRNLTEAVPELADMAMIHPGGGYLIDFDRSRGLKDIERDLADWAKIMEPHFPEPERTELGPAAARAAEALDRFGQWIEENRSKMTGSYVLGKDTYTWHLRRVLLVPHDADQLLAMAELERARALSFLQFESHKNRNLQMTRPAESAKQYLAWDDETSLLIRRFYKDLLTEPDYALPVRSAVGPFQPPFGEMYFPARQEDAQNGTPENPSHRIIVYPVDNWKWRYSNMGFRTDPGALHMHEYYPGHYLEGELHRRNPCPIRRAHRDPVHSQGWCFYNEEMPLQLDFPYVRGPRTREQIVVNMLQRALRVTQGIRLLNGEMTVQEALDWLTERLPPGLGPSLGARPEEAFEETYPVIQNGTTDTCMIGLLQIYRMLADRRMQLGETFNLRGFHDQLLALGSIPLALTRWEMTGLADEVDRLWEAEQLPLPETPKPRSRR